MRILKIISLSSLIVILLNTTIGNSYMYTTDSIGKDFIKNAEGFSPTVYKCSAGRKTIGYGHVLKENEDMTFIFKEDAYLLLLADIRIAEDAVNELVTVPLNKAQFNALVSLVYNVGANAFKKTKALKYLNEGDYDLAAIEFFDQTKGVVRSNGVIVKGLVARRKKELKMWEGNYYA